MTRNSPKFSLVCHSDNYLMNHYFNSPFFPSIKISSIDTNEAADREIKKLNLPELPISKTLPDIEVDILTSISSQPLIFSRILKCLGEKDLKNLSICSEMIRLNMKGHRCFRSIIYKSRYY